MILRLKPDSTPPQTGTPVTAESSVLSLSTETLQSICRCLTLFPPSDILNQQKGSSNSEGYEIPATLACSSCCSFFVSCLNWLYCLSNSIVVICNIKLNFRKGTWQN
ncbi:uncharacterized protein LOC130742447 [Lotus japonicus]|uniref:uncharacterized protein LOC130742447 n=1 Tax=Lotus japonicus TaxID=34305 RepID=UPI00258516F7|nr:uncharacterized protein LOC130742447 [Lotus japonicus]